MSDTSFGVAMSPEENAFFESGGEKSLPVDSGAPAPAGGETVTPAPVDTSKVAPKAPDGEPVPLATFLEEKKARKELAKSNREMAEQIAELRGKLSVIHPAPAGDKPVDNATKAPPSVEEDIFGNVKHVGETVAQLQKRLDDADKAKQDEAKANTEHQTFVNSYQTDAKQFEAKAPDYKKAYNFLLTSRASELIAIGYKDPMALQTAGASVQDVQAAAKRLHDALVADEFAIAQMAFGDEASPAERIYNLAKSRGYKSESTEPPPNPGAEKLEQIERGQQANKSFNALGGQSGDQAMTLERLNGMSLSEFAEYESKNPATVKRLMGG